MSHCFAGLPSPNCEQGKDIPICVIGGQSYSYGRDKNSSYDVLQRLKEAAHAWQNTGEMGPLAVESVSEGCIGSMWLIDGNL